jgi:hypothetical protein
MPEYEHATVLAAWCCLPRLLAAFERDVVTGV